MSLRSQASGVSLSVPTHRISGAHLIITGAGDVTTHSIASILRQDGCDVETVESLQEALLVARREPRDAVLVSLTDVPAVSGEFLARLTALAAVAPVMILAGASTVDLIPDMLRAGVEEYLIRPVDVEDLRLRLWQAIERSRARATLEARIRDLEDTQARIASVSHKLHQRIQSATDLQARIDALERENEEQRTAREEQERFVAMVAHELRGPLNPIINYAQLMKRPALKPEQVEQYSDQIVDNSLRLNRLVEDLYTATHLRTGRFSLQRQQCDVAHVVGELVRSFAATMRDREFTFESVHGPASAEIDQVRVAQAVRNLLDNAVKYSTEGGAVEVRVWFDPDQVYISVRDYGLGIPEDQMARIFDAFTRLERQPEVNGSGLGLFITRGIVEAHGGALRVANASGPERARGAVFTIVLPRTYDFSR
jgi:signal transduction histidine kinase